MALDAIVFRCRRQLAYLTVTPISLAGGNDFWGFAADGVMENRRSPLGLSGKPLQRATISAEPSCGAVIQNAVVLDEPPPNCLELDAQLSKIARLFARNLFGDLEGVIHRARPGLMRRRGGDRIVLFVNGLVVAPRTERSTSMTNELPAETGQGALVTDY